MNSIVIVDTVTPHLALLGGALFTGRTIEHRGVVFCEQISEPECLDEGEEDRPIWIAERPCPLGGVEMLQVFQLKDFITPGDGSWRSCAEASAGLDFGGALRYIVESNSDSMLEAFDDVLSAYDRWTSEVRALAARL